MSAQSGILAADALKEVFTAAKTEGTHRCIKVKIENEKMISKETVAPKGKAVDDMDLVAPLCDEKEPCYIIFRMDEKNDNGFKFILMAYVPDKSQVRLKMLYASTRESLKRELGSMMFVDELFGTVPADFNKKGYEKHLEHEAAAAPLTEAEEYYNESRQVTEQTIVAPTKSYMTVQFQFSDDATAKLKELLANQLTLVKLFINQEKEIVELDSASNTTVAELQKEILDTEPRFYLFRYEHSVTADDKTEDFNSFVMIYCCPGKTPVKSRMTYATVKPFVMDTVTTLGIKLDKKLEIFAPTEFSEEVLFEELHPKKVEEKKAFAKPSRPGRPAGKRTGTSASTSSDK